MKNTMSRVGTLNQIIQQNQNGDLVLTDFVSYTSALSGLDSLSCKCQSQNLNPPSADPKAQILNTPLGA